MWDLDLSEAKVENMYIVDMAMTCCMTLNKTVGIVEALKRYHIPLNIFFP